MRLIQKQDMLCICEGRTRLNELNPNAQSVLEYIQRNPGCHLRQIKRELNLAMGTLQYHLNLLEKMGRVISERHALHRSYYPAGIFQKDEKKILKILNQETTREILLFIMEMKNPTQTEIAQKMQISAASTNWHIQQLIEYEIIGETRDGKYKRYSISGSSDYIVTLLKNYHSRIWQKWSDRLAEMFLAMGVEKNEPT